MRKILVEHCTRTPYSFSSEWELRTWRVFVDMITSSANMLNAQVDEVNYILTYDQPFKLGITLDDINPRYFHKENCEWIEVEDEVWDEVYKEKEDVRQSLDS